MSDYQYVVDIATKVSGAGDASSVLETLGDKLTSAGFGASKLDEVLKRTSGAIEEAAAASKSASDALVAGEASYKQAEVAADRMAKAVEKGAQKIATLQAAMAKASAAGDLGGYIKAHNALAKLEGTQAENVAAANKAAAALKEEGAALDVLKDSAANAAGAHEDLKAAQSNVAKAAKTAADTEKKAAAGARGSRDVGQLAGALNQLPGPLGRVGGGIADMWDNASKLTSILGPMGGLLGGVAVGFLAVAAGVVMATAKIIEFGLKMGDAARSAALEDEALERTGQAMEYIGPRIAYVAKETGVAKEKLRDFAKQLRDAKVPADKMQAALNALAIAEATGQGDRISEFVKDLKDGKKSVEDISREMSKFSDIAKRKTLSLDNIWARLWDNVQGLFSGLNMEGFLGGLSKLADLFDKNTESGRAMKAMFERVFQPLLDGASAAFPKIERFILKIVLGFTKFDNALKPIRRGINEALGQPKDGNLLVGILTALGTAIDTIKGKASAAGAFFSGLWKFIKNGVQPGLDFLNGINLSGIGANMMAGLTNGILGGGSGVVAAMAKTVQSAISTAKTQLDQHSPSRVFEKIGGNTAEGFARGIEGGEGRAQDAMTEMVDPAAAAGVGGAGGGRTITIGDVHLHLDANSAGDPEAFVARFRRLLTDAIEGDALASSGGVPLAA